MIWGLQRRLLVLLLITIALIGAVSMVFHFQSAGTAALQQDQRLLRLVPLLADSVVVMDIAGRGPASLDEPLLSASDVLEAPALALLLAPPVDEFLRERQGFAAFGVFDAQGIQLLGERWLPTVLPATDDAEFLSVVEGGVTYRVVAQRTRSTAGDLIVLLADGSDARQHWASSVLMRVMLPNLVLFLVAAGVVTWGVARTLRPLIDLKQAVERRSPRDLSPISAETAPVEVQPLVDSLNRLFGLVNAQTEAQRRFVADAAHQLRTPLAGLQSQVEAWAQAARSLGGGDMLSLRADQVLRLRDATRRTSQLANQLLALSRVDAMGGDTQSLQQVDLAELCENILGLYLDAASGKQMDLGLETEPAQTLGHAWLLRELLINLVDNAVKYTPQGGRITLRSGSGSTPQGERVWIEVEDDGPGILAGERLRVLQRFYRVPGTAGEGNGLGLAIAEEIARVHATHLQLDNGADGRGLRVRVTLDAIAH
ncbi:ATP-binding protein [Hydrogenophaga sp.]|nr:ATP-binding protein [Hydrogenophaga sp.]MDP2074146.1 ATP-binding protein [Hydrogenophaga sp.]MDP2985876.1 ATP-binding protein [Hydrogenophaga sp.]MDP3109850.1 ATP-binding protein [Hydrogenophaga sp.]MDP3347378.1 ATP-binding protein [Hydrogenophaga sp.]MDZ4279167.1 ATP-binding protein [Hydrogenophaga sp.]